MANEVRLDLKLTGERQTARGLKDVGDAADQAGAELEGMGKSASSAGKASDKAGTQFDGMADEAGFLTTRIGELDDEIKQLLGSLNATGDTSLEKQIRKTQRELGKYKRFAKELLPDVTPAMAEVGSDAGVTLAKSLAEGFLVASAAIKGAAYPVLGAIALSAAPLIGATIGGAVLGGVGIGGIVGGVAAAASDPRISEASARLGENLADAFGGMGVDLFGAPLLATFDILEATGQNFARGLRPGLSALAPLLTPLANGLEGLGTEILPGLNKALIAAGPAVRVIADHLPEIGAAAGNAFETIADNSDGAIMALTEMFYLIEGGIELFGLVTAAASNTFEALVRSAEATTGFMSDVLGWVPISGALWTEQHDNLVLMSQGLDAAKISSGDFSGGLSVMGESAEEAEKRIKDLTDGIEKLFGQTMTLDQANLNFKDGLVRLREELTEGKRSLDDNTQAGRDNIEAVLAQIQNVEDLRRANIANGMSVDRASGLYETHIEQLRKTLLNLGYNKTAVNGLIDRYKAIPRSIETSLSVVLKTYGSATAWSMLRAQERQQAEARASGGPVKAGRPYLVGENGPELVTFDQNGTVHNASDTRAMMSGASGGAAMGATAAAAVVTVRFVVDGSDEEMKRMIRKMVKVDGGGSVQVAFGEN